MIEVIFTPSLLAGRDLSKAQVVVFDILRASSTIVRALANQARAVYLASDEAAARSLQANLPAPALLAGERNCYKIEGFDLGNSPREAQVHALGGAHLVLTTTNGTRAMEKVSLAPDLYVGSLLNATATARALLEGITSRPTLLVCAGTDGQMAMEDLVGAGAVIWQLFQQTQSPALPLGDTAWIAYQCFAGVRGHLPAALRLGQGGINLMEAGMEEDIDACALFDSCPFVARVEKNPLRVLRLEAP